MYFLRIFRQYDYHSNYSNRLTLAVTDEAAFNKGMSEHNQPTDPVNEKDLFMELLGSRDVEDAGIVLFEQHMKESEELLTQQYIGKDAPHLTNDAMEEFDDAMNDRWIYHDEIATVTGRIYIAENGIEDAIPESMGEPEEDAAGRKYFYAEEKKFRSHGVEVIPDYNIDDETSLSSVRVGFIFSLPEDEMQMPLYTAYPGELFQHRYATPTPAEAQVRLERDWPAELKIMNELLRPDAKKSLPKRLKALGAKLEPILKANPGLQQLVEIYVNEELNLDKQLPYIVTSAGFIDCFTGIDEDDNSGEWQTLEFDDTLTVLVYQPDIRFSPIGEDDGIAACIYGQTFNDSDGDAPEMVAILADNITGFRSTRAKHSLTDRALMGVESQKDLDTEKVLEAIDDEEDKKISLLETVDTAKENEYIKRLTQLEDVLGRIKRVIFEAQKKIYPTEEGARMASSELVREFKEWLDETIIYEKPIMEVSGSGILQANVRRDDMLQTLAAENQIFVRGIDRDEPLSPLVPGQIMKGQPDGLYALIGQQGGQSEEYAPSYYPAPSLSVLIAADQGFQSRLQDMLTLEDVIVRRWLSVPLDVTSEIKLVDLEEYRASKQAFDAIEKEYEGLPLSDRLQKLNEIMQNEDTTDFTELSPITTLSEIADDLQKASAEGKRTRPTANMLETLFVNRTILSVSDILQDKNGQLAPDEELSGTLVGWYVQDVRDDLIDGDIVFFVRAEVQDGRILYRYIPISSITQLKY